MIADFAGDEEFCFHYALCLELLGYSAGLEALVQLPLFQLLKEFRAYVGIERRDRVLQKP